MFARRALCAALCVCYALPRPFSAIPAFILLACTRSVKMTSFGLLAVLFPAPFFALCASFLVWCCVLPLAHVVSSAPAGAAAFSPSPHTGGADSAPAVLSGGAATLCSVVLAGGDATSAPAALTGGIAISAHALPHLPLRLHGGSFVPDDDHEDVADMWSDLGSVEGEPDFAEISSVESGFESDSLEEDSEDDGANVVPNEEEHLNDDEQDDAPAASPATSAGGNVDLPVAGGVAAAPQPVSICGASLAHPDHSRGIAVSASLPSPGDVVASSQPGVGGAPAHVDDGDVAALAASFGASALLAGGALTAEPQPLSSGGALSAHPAPSGGVAVPAPLPPSGADVTLVHPEVGGASANDVDDVSSAQPSDVGAVGDVAPVAEPSGALPAGGVSSAPSPSSVVGGLSSAPSAPLDGGIARAGIPGGVPLAHLDDAGDDVAVAAPVAGAGALPVGAVVSAPGDAGSRFVDAGAALGSVVPPASVGNDDGDATVAAGSVPVGDAGSLPVGFGGAAFGSLDSPAGVGIVFGVAGAPVVAPDWEITPMDVDEEVQDGRVHEDLEEVYDPMDIQEDATMTLRRGGWRRKSAVLVHGRRRRFMALPLGIPAYRFAGPYTVPWYKGSSSQGCRRRNIQTGALVERLGCF